MISPSLDAAENTFPWDPFAPREDPLGPRRGEWWIAAFLILGVAARVVRYALCFPLWSDEAFLAATHLSRGYLDMFRPLEYHQVCPILFLWAQHACVDLFGFRENSLRLFPLLCSLAGLAVFWRMAGRLLRGTALVLGVGIFAVGYPGIRYAAEAKPYSCDLLVSLVLMALFVEWWRQPQRLRWLWALVAAAPLAVGFSYPAVFVGGGISVAVAWVLWRARLHRGWPVWIVWNLALCGSFLLVYQTCIKAQNSELGNMRDYWHASFPPLDSAVKFTAWVVSTHSGDMLAHPFGGPRGGSTLTFICCAAAVVMLCRRRQLTLLVFAAGTLALNFAAAAVHRFPYAGHVRMALYLAPLVCLLAGLGLTEILAWGRSRWLDHSAIQNPKSKIQNLKSLLLNPLLLVLLCLAAIPLGSMVRDYLHPGKTPEDIEARKFARDFWPTMERDGEVVCLKTDRDLSFLPNLDFAPEVFQWGYSSLYLCNERIYSPRHARREPPDLSRVSAARPLRCVYYRCLEPGRGDDRKGLARWLDSMRQRYEQVGHRVYLIRHNVDKELKVVAHVEVYEFVKK